MRQQDPAAAPPATLVWLYNLLSSHDFVARGEDDLAWTDEMCHLRRRFGRVHGCRDLRSTWLYAAFFASSFTYSFIGLAMLLFFNRRLPASFWRASVIDVDLYALILVVQGPLSCWADVWARTVICVPQHIAYLADRASACLLYTSPSPRD